MHKKGLEILKIHEGFRSYVYDDQTGEKVTAPVGKATIGYGFNLEATSLPKDVAEIWLSKEVQKLEDHHTSDLSYYEDLSDVRKHVVLDMMYNLGPAGFRSFTAMNKALSQGNYHKAADEMLNSLWADQVGTRADRLAGMMKTNEWPEGIDYTI